MITLTVTIKTDPSNSDYNRVSLQINSESEVTFGTVINALIAVTDNLITEKEKIKKQQNDKDNLQLEQTATGTEEITENTQLHSY